MCFVRRARSRGLMASQCNLCLCSPLRRILGTILGTPAPGRCTVPLRAARLSPSQYRRRRLRRRCATPPLRRCFHPWCRSLTRVQMPLLCQFRTNNMTCRSCRHSMQSLRCSMPRQHGCAHGSGHQRRRCPRKGLRHSHASHGLSRWPDLQKMCLMTKPTTMTTQMTIIRCEHPTLLSRCQTRNRFGLHS